MRVLLLYEISKMKIFIFIKSSISRDKDVRQVINTCCHSFKPQEYQLSSKMCLNDVLKILIDLCLYMHKLKKLQNYPNNQKKHKFRYKT